MSRFPERHGDYWESAELKSVEKKFMAGWTIEEIAVKHKRTVNSIKLVLIRMGVTDQPIYVTARTVPDRSLVINGKDFNKILNELKKMLRSKINIIAEI